MTVFAQDPPDIDDSDPSVSTDEPAEKEDPSDEATDEPAEDGEPVEDDSVNQDATDADSEEDADEEETVIDRLRHAFYANDEPPTKKISILFEVANIFMNSQFFSGFRSAQGLEAGTMIHFNDDMAIRAGLGFYLSLPALMRETTTYFQGSEIINIDEQVFPDWKYLSATAAVDFLMFLTKEKLNPYVGGGLFVSYYHQWFKGTDDTDDYYDQIYDFSTNSLNIGLEAIFGFQWLLKQRVSIYLEYQMNLGIINYSNYYSSLITKDKLGAGTAQNETVTQSDGNGVLNVSMGLTHGIRLGVAFRL